MVWIFGRIVALYSDKELKRRNRLEDKVMISVLNTLNLRWKYPSMMKSGVKERGNQQAAGQ